MKLFYWGRICGPGGAAACDVFHTFLGAVGAAAHCAAIKNFLKFFIKKQYENLSSLSKRLFRQAGARHNCRTPNSWTASSFAWKPWDF